MGTGVDLTIKDLAVLIQSIVGHKGEILWDTSKPDGTPRKIMDSTKIKRLGWSNHFGIEKGIYSTYKWYVSQNRLK